MDIEFESIHVCTAYPVAIDSPDHYCPWGTARDNSKNDRFNHKIYRLFEGLGRFPRILDLGCSGGGFVRSCLDDGCLAVGIEGSDFSKKTSRAEWGSIGDKFLFTADISWPFEVKSRAVGDHREIPLQFDLITAWEVMEHLPEAGLPYLCENLKNHLLPGGIVVMSISTREEIIHGNRLHQTVKNKVWWEHMFASHGFYHLPDLHAYFNTQYIRGPKQKAPGSMHLILTRDRSKRPIPPSLSLKQWLSDRWHLSKGQRSLQKLFGIFRLRNTDSRFGGPHS